MRIISCFESKLSFYIQTALWYIIIFIINLLCMMNTPVESRTPKAQTPIPQETVGKAIGMEQATAEHEKIVNLDHVFPEKFGQYRVLKLIGRGGMGSVFLAEDPVLNRRVAIKTLRAEYASNEVSKERFLREARIVSALKHEHIVTIYNVGEEYGIPYLAMEYLDGLSLEDIIQKKKKLTWVQIIRLGREIARALSVAHAHNLIHRDIKPANIWLEMVDKKTNKTRLKILDFGLARYVVQENGPTQAGMVVGTPHYVSPEQARGKELDSRSDLFSLGVVLYRLSTKKMPFDGTDTLALLTSLAVDTPQRMRDHNPNIPAEFDELVMKLLAKCPDDRPASARIVADELHELFHQVVETSDDPTNSGPIPARTASTPFIAPAEETKDTHASYKKLIIILCTLIAMLTVAVIALVFYRFKGN
jgi:serine/threonine protein kinase